MASLFKRPNSIYWYIRYKSDGEWIKASTGLRHDCPNDTFKARSLRAKYEEKEYHQAAPTGGWDWVPLYLHSLAIAPRTLESYAKSWAWISAYLTHFHLDVPHIRYTHIENYIAWRTSQRKRGTGKCAGRNTAIGEVKLLAAILSEAVRRDIISANPLASMKLRRTPPAKKPALTDEEILICLSALDHEPEWMRHSFLISLHTGCRLRETRIPLSCIDLDASIPTITFPCPKGGESKAFSIPVPTALISLIQTMKTAKRLHTIDAFPFQPSRAWQHFFRRVGLPHLCFHCLRVTRITRLRREGVPREVAMRLVNHSSELIHLLYDRHQVQDLAAWRDAGQVPSAGAST